MGVLEAQKKKYEYDYPDQRKLREALELGDMTRIAKATKRSRSYITQMFDGTRKMTDDVMDLVEIYRVYNDAKKAYQQVNN